MLNQITASEQEKSLKRLIHTTTENLSKLIRVPVEFCSILPLLTAHKSNWHFFRRFPLVCFPVRPEFQTEITILGQDPLAD